MSVDPKKLRAYVAQYESREDARAAALEDQRQLLKDAEEIDGINAKVLRRLIRELKKPRAEVAAEEALLQEYRDAYLDFASTPLGQAGLTLEEVADAVTDGVRAKGTRLFAEAEKPAIVPPHGTPKRYGVRQPD